MSNPTPRGLRRVALGLTMTALLALPALAMAPTAAATTGLGSLATGAFTGDVYGPQFESSLAEAITSSGYAFGITCPKGWAKYTLTVPPFVSLELCRPRLDPNPVCIPYSKPRTCIDPPPL